MFFMFLSFSLLAWHEEFAIRNTERGVQVCTNPNYLQPEFESVLFSFYQIGQKDIWVNLNYKLDEEKILPKKLRGTPIGNILLETDLQLKQDAKEILEGIFSGQFYYPNSGVRIWIEPEKITVSNFANQWRVVKQAKLKVNVESLGLEQSTIKQLSQELTKLINSSDKYQDIRLLISAYILASQIKGKYIVQHIVTNNHWSVRRRFGQYLEDLRGEGIGGIYLRGNPTQNNISTNYTPENPIKIDTLPRWSNKISELIFTQGGNLVVVSDMDKTILKDNPVSEDITREIIKLVKLGSKFALLTGADIKKVKRLFVIPLLEYLEKCDRSFSEQVLNNILILTENGTQIYSFKGSSLSLIKITTMADLIGKDRLLLLEKFLNSLKRNYGDVRKGSFVKKGLSSFVVCPWGFGFDKETRKGLVNELGEKRAKLREKLVKKINKWFKNKNIPLIAKISGSFSIDILPKEGKGFGVKELETLSKTPGNQMIFLGDGFGPEENDETVLGRVGLVINVGQTPREGTIFLGGGPKGSLKAIEAINKIQQRYTQIKQEYCQWLRHNLNTDKRLAVVLKKLSSLPKGLREDVLKLIFPDIVSLLKERAPDVDSYISRLKNNAFALLPFDVTLIGGGSSVRHLWRNVLLGWGQPTCLYIAHNLDDGGNSLAIMNALAEAGYPLIFPPGDLANALSGFLDSWEGELLGDSSRISNMNLLLGALEILCDAISKDEADVIQLDEQKITRLLSLFWFIQEKHPELLQRRNISLRNMLLLATVLKSGEPKTNKDLQTGLDVFSQLLLDEDKRIALINTKLCTMYIMREGWTIRVKRGKEDFIFGLRKKGDHWEVLYFSEGGKQIQQLRHGKNKFKDVRIDIGRRGRVTLYEKVVLGKGGFNPYVIVDNKKVYLSRDGRGTLRSYEGEKTVKPVYQIDKTELFIIPDLIVMQTNITETFSPLKIREYGFLSITSRNPKEIFKQIDQNKIIKGTIPGNSLKSILGGNGPVIIGPGSFFTSIMPFFKTQSFISLLSEAKKEGRKIILVIGAGEDNETFGMSIGDLLSFIEKETGKDIGELIDAVVVPAQAISKRRVLLNGDSTGSANNIPYAPSISGKMSYTVQSFSSIEERENWSKKVKIIDVKPEIKETSSRIKGLNITRIYYSPQDMQEKLSEYLNIERDPILWDDIYRLKTKAQNLLQQFKDQEEGGLYLLNKILEQIISGEKDLKELSNQSYLRDIVLTRDWRNLFDINRLLLYSNAKGEIIKQIEKIDRIGEGLGLSLGNRIIAIGLVLSEFNLDSLSENFIEAGLYLLAKNKEELAVGWVQEILIEGTKPKEKGNKEIKEKVGGVLLSI